MDDEQIPAKQTRKTRNESCTRDERAGSVGRTKQKKKRTKILLSSNLAKEFAVDSIFNFEFHEKKCSDRSQPQISQISSPEFGVRVQQSTRSVYCIPGIPGKGWKSETNIGQSIFLIVPGIGSRYP